MRKASERIGKIIVDEKREHVKNAGELKMKRFEFQREEILCDENLHVYVGDANRRAKKAGENEREGGSIENENREWKRERGIYASKECNSRCACKISDRTANGERDAAGMQKAASPKCKKLLVETELNQIFFRQNTNSQIPIRKQIDQLKKGHLKIRTKK